MMRTAAVGFVVMLGCSVRVPPPSPPPAAVPAPAGAGAGERRGQVDAIVRPAMTIGGVRGCVIGLIDAGGRQVIGYGAVREGGATPDGKTLFEIGSVTKCFTALLLAEMAAAGEVRLDEPVAGLLPPGTRVPERDGHEITLLDLATHCSGLPRMPDNFAPADAADPYVDYGAPQLYAALRTVQLADKAGTSFEYSNLGAGLLGHALAQRAGKTYEQLLIERICTPLKLRDTRLMLDAGQRRRLATGHAMSGAAMQPWAFDALAGAGAIRSTVDDMLAFVAANLGLVDSPLSAAMQATHRSRGRADDERTDIALGWHIGKRTGARWHNGQTGGYHSFVAFVPDRQIGVVVLTNASGGVIDTMGTQLVQLMLGEAVEPLQLPTIEPTTNDAAISSSAGARPGDGRSAISGLPATRWERENE